MILSEDYYVVFQQQRVLCADEQKLHMLSWLEEIDEQNEAELLYSVQSLFLKKDLSNVLLIVSVK